MSPDFDSEIPPDLAELDRDLRQVRFDPRPSLGPEILGRVRRGEMPAAPPRRPFRRELAAGIAAILALAAGGGMLAHTDTRVLVDRCCYDFDGGGVPDDGVILLAERDAAVERLRIYEDLDGSRTFSPGDLVRLDRGPQPAIEDDLAPALVTTRHCCLDFDGGGPADDALLVIGVPPDRVMMAAIYERSTRPHALRLR